MIWLVLVLGMTGLRPTLAWGETFSAEALNQAMRQASGGYSTDEVLIRDDLREKFLESLASISGHSIDADGETQALLGLLQIRKAGKLTSRATLRGQTFDDSIAAVAEISARVVTDRHRVSSDTMLADPRLRDQLQREALLIRPDADAYAVRKAVLSLRKKRALRPELVLQVADWQRAIETLSLDQLKCRLRDQTIPRQPGVYLFRGNQGYLYVGEASNLAVRLSEHVGGSDRISLARYLAGDQADGVTVELHIFPNDSPAMKVIVRRAYESELIRSRDPKFNVRP